MKKVDRKSSIASSLENIPVTISRQLRKIQPVFPFIVIVIVQIYVALLAGNKIR